LCPIQRWWRNGTKIEGNNWNRPAIIERKVMVPMRDGKRMAADIYRPKDTSKKYPIIFVPHAVTTSTIGT